MECHLKRDPMSERLLSASQDGVPETASVFQRITLNYIEQIPRTLSHLAPMTFSGPPEVYFLYIPGLGVLMAIPFGTLCSLA